MNDLKSLQDIFNNTIFRIPDYQRGYSWRNLQLEEFWLDLTELIKGQEHYTGMLSLKEVTEKEIKTNTQKWQNEQWLIESGHKVYEIVDGQQRLTTIIILINEIINYCEKNQIEYISYTSLNDIKERYIAKHKINGISKTYKFGYEIDNPSYFFFKEKVIGNSISTAIKETYYTLNLQNAKDFFAKQISDLFKESRETGILNLENIFKKINMYLKFNIYYIQDNFNVFVAFETMNNRGKKLSYLELLKNRLIYLTTLFNVEEYEKEEVRKNINETWMVIYEYLGKNKEHPLNDDEFLQHHWMIYFGYQTSKIASNYSTYLLKYFFVQQNINNKKGIPVEDHDFDYEMTDADIENMQEKDIYDNDTIFESYNNKEIKLTLDEIDKYVNSLKNLIPFWYSTFNPTEISNVELKKYLLRNNNLGYVNTRPLVTVILSKQDMPDKDKIELIKSIERFNFMHFRLSGYSNNYNKPKFNGYARDLYKNKISFKEILEIMNKIDYLDDNNMVPQEMLKFDKLNKSGFYDWGTTKLLLYIYDVRDNVSESENRLDVKEYFKQDPKDCISVEHIFPQKPTNEYWQKRFGKYTLEEQKSLANSLGNLLPLSKKVNSKLQNSSFDDKKKRYINGSRSEVEVSKNKDNEISEWTSKEIKDRGLKLLEFMEKEWKFKFKSYEQKLRILGIDFLE